MKNKIVYPTKKKNHTPPAFSTLKQLCTEENTSPQNHPSFAAAESSQDAFRLINSLAIQAATNGLTASAPKHLGF